jgi:hypothetical protein
VVNRLRSLLAQALAALLLLQWGSGPAHCLAMAALALDGAVICHASDGSAPRQDAPLTQDASCPVCHALGRAIVTPEPPLVPLRLVWSAATSPTPRPATNPTAPRAPSQQPRAPPARSV